MPQVKKGTKEIKVKETRRNRQVDGGGCGVNLKDITFVNTPKSTPKKK